MILLTIIREGPVVDSLLSHNFIRVITCPGCGVVSRNLEPCAYALNVRFANPSVINLDVRSLCV